MSIAASVYCPYCGTHRTSSCICAGCGHNWCGWMNTITTTSIGVMEKRKVEEFNSLKDIVDFLENDAVWAPETNVFFISVTSQKAADIFGYEPVTGEIEFKIPNSQRSFILKIKK